MLPGHARQGVRMMISMVQGLCSFACGILIAIVLASVGVLAQEVPSDAELHGSVLLDRAIPHEAVTVAVGPLGGSRSTGLIADPKFSERYWFVARGLRPDGTNGDGRGTPVRLRLGTGADGFALMGAETGKRYRDEVQARKDAIRSADASMLVNLIDQHVTLDPRQYQDLRSELDRSWQGHWSNRHVVLLYPLFCALPEDAVVLPSLSDAQQQLWSDRSNRRRVRLSWEVYFAGSNMFAGIGMKPFEPPAKLETTEAPQ